MRCWTERSWPRSLPPWPVTQPSLGKLTVLDHERLTITTSKSTLQETNDSITVTVIRSNTDISQQLLVELSASNLLIPSSVTIPAGQSSVTFTANANGSIVQTGSQAGVITATAAGYDSGRAEVRCGRRSYDADYQSQQCE